MRFVTSLDTGKTKLKFDVIDETLARTNLKLVKKNSLVNLERSITASTEIGGHLMLDIYILLERLKKLFLKKILKILLLVSQKNLSSIFEKGYIGVNGCSLTIGK